MFHVNKIDIMPIAKARACFGKNYLLFFLNLTNKTPIAEITNITAIVIAIISTVTGFEKSKLSIFWIHDLIAS